MKVYRTFSETRDNDSVKGGEMISMIFRMCTLVWSSISCLLKGKGIHVSVSCLLPGVQTERGRCKKGQDLSYYVEALVQLEVCTSDITDCTTIADFMGLLIVAQKVLYFCRCAHSRSQNVWVSLIHLTSR